MVLRQRKLMASLVILFMGAVASQTQVRADCPVKHKLSLEQVAGFIERKVPEERTVSLIESCHVNFSLNAAALSRLNVAGVTDAELEALNRETLALLTVDLAHDEVSDLERYISDSNKTVAARGADDLAKLNVEYQLKRAKAANIPPKGPFETTQEYNQRKEQSEAALAAMDASHEQEVARLTAQFAAQARTKARPFKARIEYLQQAVYADPAKATYRDGGYDADKQELTASIAGEDYLFERVPPETARQLVENWKNVTVARPYTEGKMGNRVLRLEARQVSIGGQSLKLVLSMRREQTIDKKIREANDRASRKDYEEAIDLYQDVLKLDPNNNAVREAAAATMAAKQLRDKLVSDGVWVDSRTSLMWTAQDNVGDITWKGAIDYCQALRKGGFTDWSLPPIEALEALYDPASTRSTPPLPADEEWFSWGDGKSYSLSKGEYWRYHIAGGIVLNRPTVWSTSRSTIRQDNLTKTVIYVADFSKVPQKERRVYDFPSEKHVNRALCMRSSSNSGEIAPVPLRVAEEPKGTDRQQDSEGSQGQDSWLDSRTGLRWTKNDNGKDVTHKDALTYCQDLQTEGLSGWRAPTIDELEKLFDLSSVQIDTKNRNYHIARGIKLTNSWSWSATPSSATGFWAFDFEKTGKRFAAAGGPFSRLPVVCVHD